MSVSEGMNDETRSSTSCATSTIWLNPTNDVKRIPWWRKRQQHIFRKKTLYKRLPILQWLPKYSFGDVIPDLLAGITVGITAIPQGLAYATLAGLPPQYGLYSAYVGSFVYVVLGSTRVITIGPSSLLSLLSYEPVALMGPGAAVLLAFLTGCISLLVGMLNLGFLIDFIGPPVIGGFTTAAAITTATTQIKSLLGLSFQADGFIHTWIAVFEHIDETRLWDAVMGFSCIFLLLLLRFLDKVKVGKGNPTRLQRALNGSLWFLSASRNAVIIIVATIIAACLSRGGESDTFILTGNITEGLPPFQAPPFYIEYNNQTFNFEEICQNFGSVLFAAPLVAILESVGIAKSFAKGEKMDASQEMIAIGTSNLLGSFGSSYAITGSFSRSAVNEASGVHTPFGGIYTGALVLLAITVMTPYFYFIPKSSLAAVIICAMIFMIEIHLTKMIWNIKKTDLIPLAVTFIFCLFLSLEHGILIGTAVSLAMLLYTTARPRIKLYKMNNLGLEYLSVTPDRSLVFTAMDYFMKKVRKATTLYSGLPVVIDMRHSSVADFTTAYGINNLTEDLRKKGRPLILTNTEPQVVSVLEAIKPKLHFHNDGTDIFNLLQEIHHLDANNNQCPAQVE